MYPSDTRDGMLVWQLVQDDLHRPAHLRYPPPNHTHKDLLDDQVDVLAVHAVEHLQQLLAHVGYDLA